MAQSPHIGLYWPFTNLAFGICAIYFASKVSQYILACQDPHAQKYVYLKVIFLSLDVYAWLCIFHLTSNCNAETDILLLFGT